MKSRTRVKIAVFCVLSVHVVGLMALLLTQGCRRQEEPPPSDFAMDTNMIVDPFEPTNAIPDVGMYDPAPATSAPPVYTPPVYTAPVPEPAPTQYSYQEYTVVRGDTFYDIARKFGVTVRAIQDANPGVEPTRLRVGQKLQIPPPAAVTPSVTAPTAPAAGEQVYTVKSGDTLTRIASQFNTTVKAIRSANNLTTDRIVVGQKLKIPASETTPSTLPGTR